MLLLVVSVLQTANCKPLSEQDEALLKRLLPVCVIGTTEGINDAVFESVLSSQHNDMCIIYIYIYISIYIYIYVYIYMCINKYIYIYMCINIYIYMYVCVFVCVSVCVCVCMCVCVCVRVCVCVCGMSIEFPKNTTLK